MKLDAFLLLGLAGLSACVIPVAPQFEDPEINVAPYIVENGARPSVGSIITVPPNSKTLLEVTLADPNLADYLYVKCILDYPPYNVDSTRTLKDYMLAPSTTGDETREVAPFTADCNNYVISPTVYPHRLFLAVTDREWEPGVGDLRLTAIKKGARLLVASWILNWECN